MTSNIVNKGKKLLSGGHSSHAKARNYMHLRSEMLAPQKYKKLADKEDEEYSDHSATTTP